MDARKSRGLAADGAENTDGGWGASSALRSSPSCSLLRPAVRFGLPGIHRMIGNRKGYEDVAIEAGHRWPNISSARSFATRRELERGGQGLSECAASRGTDEAPGFRLGMVRRVSENDPLVFELRIAPEVDQESESATARAQVI